MKMDLLKSKDGFTLVELMVVVAIVGILSAVAIPNFKKYQAKSKTSEAKLALSGIYSAETSLQADYDYFGSCLNYAGFSPTPQYYAIGFSAQAAVNSDIRDNGGLSCADADQSVWPATKKVAGVTVAVIAGPAVVDGTGSTFVAHAEGRISSDAGVNSIWQINEDKSLLENAQGY